VKNLSLATYIEALVWRNYFVLMIESFLLPIYKPLNRILEMHGEHEFKDEIDQRDLRRMSVSESHSFSILNI